MLSFHRPRTVRSADRPRTVFKEKFEKFNKKLQCKLERPSAEGPQVGWFADGKKYFSD